MEPNTKLGWFTADTAQGGGASCMKGTGHYRNQDQRSAIGGDQSRNAQYDQPKGRLFEQAQNFRNVVVIGTDDQGEQRMLSSLPQAETAEWLERVTELSPTT
jgi:hypothetical protein